ncbi:MlaD family protein [Mycolicibacterium neoaurum]|uniref:MlaD family protein n=1 Tax=Mycolicibacterium neoaurum TaxID=1795 RepID=UPI0026735F01|nr:MlaD family protein [Mycolicibacterium neoaurum]MDO3401774.1 MlaD family protein [Mycolicibacterium neoaurum]
MMTPRGALWRFALSAIAASFVFILIVNVMRQPVAAETQTYEVAFADISGLHVDADVRVRGVRVGKVHTMELQRNGGQSVAVVGMTMDTRYSVVPDTRLAVKYQALTGLRYIDVTNPAEGEHSADVVTRVPTTMTQPSFDITTLFNGLQPVLATLSPADIDTFTDNVAAFMEGDGSGLGPMLESIHTLTDYVANRQEVVATIIRNLSALADTFGGHSRDLVQVLDWMNRPIDSAMAVLDEFRKSQLYGPAFTASAVRLLHNMGFEPGKADIDDGLDRAVTVLDDYSDAFKRIPVLWDAIDPPADPSEPMPCAKGQAQLPASLDVLLNGQRVILCN